MEQSAADAGSEGTAAALGAACRRRPAAARAMAPAAALPLLAARPHTRPSLLALAPQPGLQRSVPPEKGQPGYKLFWGIQPNAPEETNQ